MCDHLPSRGDVGLAEATRDPIFLLQARDWHLSSEGWPPGLDYGGDIFLLRGESLTEEEVRERFPDHFREEWRTVSVWFTREEAEDFGQRTHYRYPDGFRVFCVCAEGELADLLKARSAQPTGTLEPERAKGATSL